MEQYGEVDCTVLIEKLNKHGQVTKRDNFSNAFVKLGRDELHDVILKVNQVTFILKDFKIFSRFVKEGKASLIFTTVNTNVLLSNAPPDRLAIFVKLLQVKSGIQKSHASDHARLYSTAPKAFEDISPLTLQDVKTFKEGDLLKSPLQQMGAVKRKCSDITPVRVTKRGLKVADGGPRKRLNSVPITTIKLGEKKPSCVHKTVKGEQKLSDHIDLKKQITLSGKLTSEQTEVLNAVEQGYNVFFTGSAGTGKSYLLKRIIGILPPETTVAAASTGVAACQIGGITLHSFAGIGLGEASVEHCIKLASRLSVKRNWNRCKTLIIDEISMIDSIFFDKLEKVARFVRNDDRPFGGIQLVLCGDFLQLPPVQKEKENRFCFQSSSWTSCVQLSYELTDIKRQNDKEFINILQYIRVGKCPDHVYDRLMQTQHHPIERFGIQATRLCTHKDSAEEINRMKMKELRTEAKVFVSSDSDTEYTSQLDKYLPALHKLELKVGTQVMLTKNLDVSKGLVNGARGVVTKFLSDRDGLPLVKFSQGLHLTIKREKFVYKTPGAVVTRLQLPLKLAWAISIHKSQGLTLDCCEVSLSRVFEHGQAYVALSRAKSLDGLRILDMTRNCVKAHTDVLKFYIRLRREIRKATIQESEKK